MENMELLKEILEAVKTLQNDVAEIKEVTNKINKSQIKMEKEFGDKIGALFDAREIQIDTDDRIEKTLADISGKVNKIEWKLIKDNVYREVK